MSIYKAVCNFFISEKLLKEVNYIFPILIPKISDSSHLADFRPISCCSVLYKIISKVLNNVITDLMSSNQSVFLMGRQSSDCYLLAHELVRDFKKKNPKGCCLKIDIHKASDNVNMDFVISIMKSMGFPNTWLSWIRECIYTPYFLGDVEWFFHMILS